MPDDPLSRRIAAFRGPKGGRARTGTLKGLREAWDDHGLVRLELEGDRKPVKGTKGGPVSIPDSFDATVPKSEAAGLKIGDRVTVRTFVEKGGDDAGEK